MDAGYRAIAWSDSAKLPVGVTSINSAAANNTDLFSVDATQFRSIAVALSGTFSATVQWQGSHDGSNWFTISGFASTGGSSGAQVSATGTGVFIVPVFTRFVRARTTTYASGTVLCDAIAYYDDRSGAMQLSAPVDIASFAPSTSKGGFPSFSHTISAASVNATVVKASAGVIGNIILSNSNAAARYFKLYNKATTPTVGTDTPVMTVLIPAGSTIEISQSIGMRLSAGVSFGLTTGMAVSDTGAVGAGDVAVSIVYI